MAAVAAGAERPQVVSHVQQALSYTLFDCKWVPRSARLLCLGSAARGTGVLQLYELRAGRLALLREVSGGKGKGRERPRLSAEGAAEGGLGGGMRAPAEPVVSFPGKIEKAKPIKCGTFGAASLQQRYLATGDFAGSLNVW